MQFSLDFNELEKTEEQEKKDPKKTKSSQSARRPYQPPRNGSPDRGQLPVTVSITIGTTSTAVDVDYGTFGRCCW